MASKSAGNYPTIYHIFLEYWNTLTLSHLRFWNGLFYLWIFDTSIVANRGFSNKSRTEWQTMYILMRWLITSHLIWIYIVCQVSVLSCRAVTVNSLSYLSYLIVKNVIMMQWQTVQTQIKLLLRSSLIWVYTVCSRRTVWQIRTNAIFHRHSYYSNSTARIYVSWQSSVILLFLFISLQKIAIKPRPRDMEFIILSLLRNKS